MVVRRINNTNITITQELGDFKRDYLSLIETYELMGYAVTNIHSYDNINKLSNCILTLAIKVANDEVEKVEQTGSFEHCVSRN